MDKNINLTFTENCYYRLEFAPADFWKPFAEGYDALTWEKGKDSLVSSGGELLLPSRRFGAGQAIQSGLARKGRLEGFEKL